MLMHHVLRFPLRSTRSPPFTQVKRNISDARPFAPGDPVLLRHKINRYVQPILARTLTPGKEIKLPRGSILHDDIIGKTPREIVFSKRSVKKGKDGGKAKPDAPFRIHSVRLDDYVRLTERLVTPIYPADAAVIVELLDLHPTALHHHNTDPSSKLEILEAGTGHGALTLYLARALHAGNAHLPQPPSEADSPSFAEWKLSRRAILHTLDIKPAYTSHARKTISSFRTGLYIPTIDFHTSPVTPWIREALDSHNNEPFLSHAILDLPDADQQLADVTAALKTDGTCVVFNPSITQIMGCLRKVRDEGLQLELEKVVELPGNGGAGGREWDVRPVVPRSRLKIAVDETANDLDGEYRVFSDDSNDATTEDGGTESAETLARDLEECSPSPENGQWEMICRPKVGGRISGGGFLGVFRKWRDMRSSST